MTNDELGAIEARHDALDKLRSDWDADPRCYSINPRISVDACAEWSAREAVAMRELAASTPALLAEIRRLRERSEGCCRCTHPLGCQCWNDE